MKKALRSGSSASGLVQFVFVALLGAGGYKLYHDQQNMNTLLETLRAHPLQKEVRVVERVVSDRSWSWSDIQSKFRNSVVQIFTTHATVDLLEPYKSPTQYSSTGSGFFINPEGELITNAHVVDQAKAVWIQIPALGKRQIDVDVIGLSFERDLALLRVKPEGMKIIGDLLGALPYLTLGDSDFVHRADEIMTLGYPLGQQNLKSTVGVVSGLEQHLIQIDAPINPGNSGGPSVNSAGEVIGINTMYIAGAQNVGYIIPINHLKIIIDDLRRIKLLKKPYLGILYINANDSLTQYLGNPQPGGLYIVDVYKGSPLEKAGVKPRDMIYEINGHRLDVYGELEWNGEKISIVDYVSQLKLGEAITLLVYRNGSAHTITLEFGQTEPLAIHKIYPGYEKLDYEIIAGMVIQPLAVNHLPLLVNQAPSLAKFAELKHQVDPVLLVTHIFPDSQAQRSRTLLPGIVLQEINGQKVQTLEDLRKAYAKSVDTGVLTVESDSQVFVVFPFKKVLEDEVRLSRDYFYPLSSVIQELIAQMGINNKSSAPLTADALSALSSHFKGRIAKADEPMRSENVDQPVV